MHVTLLTHISQEIDLNITYKLVCIMSNYLKYNLSNFDDKKSDKEISIQKYRKVHYSLILLHFVENF